MPARLVFLLAMVARGGSQHDVYMGFNLSRKF
jgi:hypothetical protein